MFLDPFHTEGPDGISISARQGSRFAKEIAGDFNPIHDPGNKRFCVPGDLLFSLVLARYGLSPRMELTFSGMLGAGVPVLLPPTDDEGLSVRDADGRSYLEVSRQGPPSRDPAVIEAFVRCYVAFSGRNFPHILVPLMERHRVMINTERPLVVYQSMSFDLQRTDTPELALELADSTLEQSGKRGEARLHFRIRSGGELVGEGFKKLLLSGLREYDAAMVQSLVERYAGWKAAYRDG